MAYSLQIVVDCHDPHRLADWWAETMGWQVEPSDEDFIRSMVLQGHATEEQTLLHRGVLVWANGAAIAPDPKAHTSGKAPTLNAAQPRILFQRSEQRKTGKNRIHWDVRLGGEDKQVVRAQLESRGAVFLWEDFQGPHAWFTMADPEGNEFCIS
ncbi:VOC family protein [Specibacter sp. NPDC057265]|uniref:VOC family protein n=1 Tax=Specibacter sp. NPDC057265 TaxID=3346075 RepID=UPI00362F1B34